MSHDQTMRAVYGVTLETVVRRIVRTFDAATPSDVESGARWYDEAGDLAMSLTGYDDGNSRAVTVEGAAAVIAALSPRTPWSRNVAGAVAFIRSGRADALDLGCLTTNVDRAERVLSATADPIGALDTGTAPKVHAFARNIAGDREAVTVDVWACRVADLDDEKLSRKGAYDAVAHAYRLAARRRGVDPATMQATTWIVARNGRAA